MSEGPEVRRTADRLAKVLVGKTIEVVELRRRVPLDPELKARIEGARVLAVRTHGKHLVIAFGGGTFLHNHMMMFGKWRVYSRKFFDRGDSKPPPRVTWRRRGADAGSDRVGPTVTDVRNDSRVRLILKTKDHVAVEFNGPLLQFGVRDPAQAHASLLRIGPDGLAKPFAVTEVEKRLRERGTRKLADLLLDQSFVAGVGNKYKSEILFVQGLYPFQRARDLPPAAETKLLAEIPRTLEYGYVNGGRTRPLAEGETRHRWDAKHWVFRRGGRPCWECGTKILADRTSSARVTFYCPRCQPLPDAPAVPKPAPKRARGAPRDPAASHVR